MEASSYKPTHEKPPARTLGFLSNQMVARGGIDQGLRMFDPNRSGFTHSDSDKQ